MKGLFPAVSTNKSLLSKPVDGLVEARMLKQVGVTRTVNIPLHFLQ